MITGWIGRSLRACPDATRSEVRCVRQMSKKWKVALGITLYVGLLALIVVVKMYLKAATSIGRLVCRRSDKWDVLTR
jgi:hypothetical protein